MKSLHTTLWWTERRRHGGSACLARSDTRADRDYSPPRTKACYLYYRDGLTRTEIAKNLGLSRFQVARILDSAADNGYVTVKIREPDSWHSDLERVLEREFALKSVVIVDDDDLSREEVRRRAADAAGDYLLDILRNGDHLGVSLGKTVGSVVHQLPDRIDRAVSVVQLIGGSPSHGPGAGADHLTAELASRFGTKPILLYAPAVVSDNGIRRTLLGDAGIRTVYSEYTGLRVALLGVGALDHEQSSHLLHGGYVGKSLRRELRNKGAVGDVLSYTYTENGEVVASELDERLVAIPLDDLFRIPYRIGVATGGTRRRPFRARLAAGSSTP